MSVVLLWNLTFKRFIDDKTEAPLSYRRLFGRLTYLSSLWGIWKEKLKKKNLTTTLNKNISLSILRILLKISLV